MAAVGPPQQLNYAVLADHLQGAADEIALLPNAAAAPVTLAVLDNRLGQLENRLLARLVC
jgi:hypothetical protein